MRANGQSALFVKLTILLFMAASLLADSKTEKALQAKVTAALQERDEAIKSKAAAIERADRNLRTLQQENARQAQELVESRSGLQRSMEARDALQSLLNAQLEAAKFQAGAVKARAESDKGNAKVISDAVAGTIAHTATVRHAANLAELKKGTEAATEAAQASGQAAQVGEDNHRELMRAVEAVKRHTEMISEIQHSEIMSRRLQVILTISVIMQFSICLALIFRGRKF